MSWLPVLEPRQNTIAKRSCNGCRGIPLHELAQSLLAARRQAVRVRDQRATRVVDVIA